MQKTYKDWYLKPEIQQAQYLNLVNNALIPHYVKDYLRYIASKCSWAGTKDPTRSYSGCYARQDLQEIHMSRSSDYVGKAKRAALKLKWIQVKKRPGTSDEIFPTIGEDDPSMKQKFPRESWVRSDIKPIQLEINS